MSHLFYKPPNNWMWSGASLQLTKHAPTRPGFFGGNLNGWWLCTAYKCLCDHRPLSLVSPLCCPACHKGNAGLNSTVTLSFSSPVTEQLLPQGFSRWHWEWEICILNGIWKLQVNIICIQCFYVFVGLLVSTITCPWDLNFCLLQAYVCLKSLLHSPLPSPLLSPSPSSPLLLPCFC